MFPCNSLEILLMKKPKEVICILARKIEMEFESNAFNLRNIYLSVKLCTIIEIISLNLVS